MPKQPEDNPLIDRLFEAINAVESVKECRLFLYDLCTMRELEDMALRLQVAELLLDGCTYEEIIEKTAVSTATISRINRFIQYGSGGYKSVIEKL